MAGKRHAARACNALEGVGMTAAERRASYPFDEYHFEKQTGSRLADVLRNFRGE